MDRARTGMIIGIDLADIRRSMEAREQLKAKAMSKQQEQPQHENPNFEPRRLINTVKERGRLLDVVA